MVVMDVGCIYTRTIYPLKIGCSKSGLYSFSRSTYYPIATCTKDYLYGMQSLQLLDSYGAIKLANETKVVVLSDLSYILMHNTA